MKTLLTLLLLIPSLIWGEEINTFLTLECGQINSRLEKEKLNTENYLFGVLTGYISAKNEELEAKVGYYTSNESLFQQLLLYCKNNPLDILHNAVLDTYKEIKAKELIN